MKKKLIYIVTLTLTITACTQEAFLPGKSGVESKILLSNHPVSIIAKRNIHVWADSESGAPHFNAWELTSDGQGSLSPTGEMQYFPDGDETLSLYSLSGNFTKGDIIAGETPFPAQGLSYSVGSDQRGEMGYSDSDLLYAAQNNVGQEDGSIDLRFYHMLSKVEVLLKPGGGVTAEELRKATVLIDAVVDGSFTPKKVTTADLADVSVRNNMVAATGTLGTIQTSPKVIDDATKTEYGCAVFFPQTVTGRFITIILSDNRRYYYTAKELTFESGKHYIFRLTPDSWSLEMNLQIQDWTDGGSVTTQPNLSNKITIDTTTEFPEGAEINQAQDILTMNHLPIEFTLAVACDNELEFVSDPNLPLTVEPLAETTWNGYNRFKITKTLIPPRFSEEKAVLRFRRKGLTEVYKEDTITLVSRENPVIISGKVFFDRKTYTCDFGRYIDGELSILELPEGKKATLTMEQDEDIWATLDTPASEPTKRRILGGWRPNDPKADGREQRMTLTISDTDGSNPEQYTIKRRNWGLPVVNIEGTWWSKYNLRGNGINFTDQILSKNDPSGGSSLYEYLQKCTEDELLDLLGHQYQGGYSQGLPLSWDATNSEFYYGGMKGSAAGFATIADSLMVPSGYRLPRYEDYAMLTQNQNFNLGGPGTTTYRNSQNKIVTVSISLRDTWLLRQHYGFIGFYEFQVGDAGDKIVLYGLGHQFETAHGKLARMHILLATVNQKGAWAILGSANAGNPGENRFRFETRNNIKTNTMRCIKSPVEYMY